MLRRCCKHPGAWRPIRAVTRDSIRDLLWLATGDFLMPGTKICTKCNIEKSLDEFRARNNRPSRRSRCLECERGDGREYNARNRDRVAAKNRKYHEANKDAINVRHQKYRKENPERVRERRRRYSVANKEKEIAYSRRYEADHRAQRVIKSTKWRINNPEKNRAIKARREAVKKNAPGFFTHADIEALLIKQGGMCAYHLFCPGCRGEIRHSYEIDHIVPLSRGGSNWPQNLQLLCRHCNASKNAKTHDEFMAVLA